MSADTTKITYGLRSCKEGGDIHLHDTSNDQCLDCGRFLKDEPAAKTASVPRLDAQMKLLPSYASADEIKAFDLGWDARDEELREVEARYEKTIDQYHDENKRLKGELVGSPRLASDGVWVESNEYAAIFSKMERMREALADLAEKSERLVFGSHGTAFLPGQMQDWKESVARALALKDGGPRG